MKFCDLHTHVLPGVDDGASTMEYALQMLQNAVASDVTMLAATPHFVGTDDQVRDLRERFMQLKEAAKDIPVQLFLGAEMWVDAGLMENLRRGNVLTVNDSRYMLTEFPTNTLPEDFDGMLQEILEFGYIPLVAHPERYMAVCETPQIVYSWLDMGCHLQLTGGSILGEYGKNVQRAAAFLLQQDLVACVASDAHGVNRRSNFLLDVYDHLMVYYSKQYAQCLMYENPMGICLNHDI